MNYELAKELKDAGFPQIGDGYALVTAKGEGEIMHSIPWCQYVMRPVGDSYEVFYAPILSELIDGCGPVQKDGEKRYEFLLSFSVESWFAGYYDEHFVYHPTIENGEGKTPEEAVARLWLALNKKA